jgi:dimethylhistidine N-methyltransferase
MIAHSALALPAIAEDVRAGLTRMPKALPPKLFYDGRGSELFEQITRLPEYYLTRTELSILQANASDIAAAAGPGITVIELGAGSAEKTCTLLSAISRRQLRLEYWPIDVSEGALAFAKERVARECAGVKIRPLVSDYTTDLDQVRALRRRKLVLYIGSSIGNFEHEDATRVLRRVRGVLASGDALLLGTDMRKHESILLPAYDDAQGVTVEFNKNMLARINRELGGHFDLNRFRHIARWNSDASAIEIYLESTCNQRVAIDALNLRVPFSAGERIHTENSFKYTMPQITRMLETCGFTRERTWSDERNWFTVHLARAL